MGSNTCEEKGAEAGLKKDFSSDSLCQPIGNLQSELCWMEDSKILAGLLES